MREKYLEENKWWVSPYNFVDEVRAGFDLPKRVEIHDATLRDGETDSRSCLPKGGQVQDCPDAG